MRLFEIKRHPDHAGTAKLERVGEMYLTVYEEGELISHMLAHVFKGVDPHGEPIAHSPIGECYFEAVDHPSDPMFMPGFREVLEAVRKEEPFFLEVVKRI